MLQVLIADDEQWIRRWLEKVIPELGQGYEVAGAVENGAEALRLLQTQPVDIVVSDVRMPMLTGLDLAQAAREGKAAPQFILVSGYDQFAYAKRAIDLQVVAYLLKPIDREELRAALHKAAQAIEQQRGMQAGSQVFRDAIHRLTEQYLREGEPALLERLERTLAAAGCRCTGVYAGVLQCDISLENSAQPGQVLREMLGRYYADCISLCVLEDNMNYVFAAFQYRRDPGAATLRSAAEIKNSVRGALPRCRIELSRRFEAVRDLPEAVAEARGRILEGYIREKSAAVVDTSRSRLLAVRSSILLAIRGCDLQALQESAQLLQEMFLGKNSNSDDCRYVLFSLVSEVIRMLADVDGSFANPYVARGYSFCVKIENYQNVPAMVEWFVGYAGQVIDYLKRNQSFNVPHIAARVRNYLLEHYAEEISLASICGKFGINSSYFSKKFKEEIGMNFVDCLTGIRMDAARRLLESTDRPVAEIGRSVGVRDAKYFSKLFQNSTGMTPSQYREARRGKV